MDPYGRNRRRKKYSNFYFPYGSHIPTNPYGQVLRPVENLYLIVELLRCNIQVLLFFFKDFYYFFYIPRF